MGRRGAGGLLPFTGVPPVRRIGGRLVRWEGPELEGSAMQSLLGNFLTSRIRERLHADGAADFSLRLHRPPADDDRRSWRFRANIHHQRGTLEAAFRVLPAEIPTLQQLNLP